MPSRRWAMLWLLIGLASCASQTMSVVLEERQAGLGFEATDDSTQGALATQRLRIELDQLRRDLQAQERSARQERDRLRQDMDRLHQRLQRLESRSRGR